MIEYSLAKGIAIISYGFIIDLILISVILRPKWWICVYVWFLITLSKIITGGFFLAIAIGFLSKEKSILTTDGYLLIWGYVMMIIAFGIIEYLFLYYTLAAEQKKAIIVSFLAQTSFLIWVHLMGGHIIK